MQSTFTAQSANGVLAGGIQELASAGVRKKKGEGVCRRLYGKKVKKHLHLKQAYQKQRCVRIHTTLTNEKKDEDRETLLKPGSKFQKRESLNLKRGGKSYGQTK